MGSQPITSHSGTNHHEYVGRFKRVKRSNLVSGKDRSKQRIESFLDELEEETADFTDEEFAGLEQIMGRRGRDTAHVVVAQIDTA